MAAFTSTITQTYTKTDVRRVFESCMADIRMIAWRTAAIEEQDAKDTLADVQIMAEEGCLKTVHIQLCDRQGRIVKAHLYTATDGMGSSDRPGGNQWPRMPEGEVRVIVSVEHDEAWDRAQKRLRKNWGPSDHSTDYSGMSQTGTRTFSHGGYGLTRLSFG